MSMSTISVKPLLHHYSRSCRNPKFGNLSSPNPLSHGGRTFSSFKPLRVHLLRATSTGAAVAEPSLSEDVLFKETFPLKRTVKEEGKISVRLEGGKEEQSWQLAVGCSLPGKWILHWGVSYIDDVGSEWDQPPDKMRPPGSIPVKDYAIETPLTKPPPSSSSSSSTGDTFQEVKIDCEPDSRIAAINFVLKDEETGAWYQHKGRDFKVPLVDFPQDDGPLGQLSSESTDPGLKSRRVEGFFEEQPIAREAAINCSVCVSLRKCPETAKNLLHLETDIPEDVVVHWGICRDESKNWEIPAAPYPPETKQFKNKALRTLLQPKETGVGSAALFTLEEDFAGFLFVLKLNGNSWLNCMGNDFYIPLSSSSSLHDQQRQGHLGAVQVSGETAKEKNDSPGIYTDGIVDEIRSLVSNIASEKKWKTKNKEAQETILQEIEKLAAEAYSIFRTSRPTFSEEEIVEPEAIEPPVKIRSGTGSGFEILCQGFNWESHKSGRWYIELKEKAEELARLGITVIWLPPPTDSVSPEGYMPRDLYDLNSRYGSMDELKDLVKKLQEVGITALGDVVLNHRCAQYQNKNGIWNIFGGKLNWDDRAVVADDPHFQGRGNKSSGDCFHAAPNIDHSQDFVRNDIKEWLLWLRKEIGYDGWRIDFVRGFWGGYVKDYLDASEPYFSVGEYWDSLSYAYGEMEHDQDPHRQRIVDWINATGGTSGAFDVTTKGILHAALEKCEYWRLSDKNGKPPGVVGWWPSRAVTFIENHDTGSTQGHWRFPSGKEMQGYAYILTHSGTPSVFYDHIFSRYNPEIAALISIRNRNKIQCRSTVNITKAERDVYAAVIDDKVAVKIGPGHYEPQSGNQQWSVAAEGRDYKVWETSS